MWLVAAIVAGAFALGKLALGHAIPSAAPVFGSIGVVFGLGLRSTRAAALVGLGGLVVAVALWVDMPPVDDCAVHPDVTSGSHCSQRAIDEVAMARRGYKLDIGTMLALGATSGVALVVLRRRR